MPRGAPSHLLLCGAHGRRAEHALALQGEPGHPGSVGCRGINGSQVGLPQFPSFAIWDFVATALTPSLPCSLPREKWAPLACPAPGAPRYVSTRLHQGMRKPHGDGVSWDSWWGCWDGRVSQGSPSPERVSSSWAVISTHPKICKEADGGGNLFCVPCSGGGVPSHRPAGSPGTPQQCGISQERFCTTGFARCVQGFDSNSSSLSPAALQGPQGLQGRRGPPGPRGMQVSGCCPGSEPTMSLRCGSPRHVLAEQGRSGWDLSPTCFANEHEVLDPAGLYAHPGVGGWEGPCPEGRLLAAAPALGRTCRHGGEGKGELIGTWSLGRDVQLLEGRAGFLWAGVSSAEQDSEQHPSSPKPPTAFAFPQGPAGMEGSAGPKGDTVRASCWLALTLVGMKPRFEGFP